VKHTFSPAFARILLLLAHIGKEVARIIKGRPILAFFARVVGMLPVYCCLSYYADWGLAQLRARQIPLRMTVLQLPT
jgi:hypothetical protein